MGGFGVLPGAAHTITLSARPELRDDAPSGDGVIPNSNDVRMISTGTITCASQWLYGAESLYILGPLSFQAECGWTQINDATAVAAQTGASLSASVTGAPAIALKTPTDYTFFGGYVQVSYMLTQEYRAYDRRLGRLSTYYLGKQGPHTPFWLVRDNNGNFNSGLGAWELAARYSYVNLNDGTGSARIQGGIMDGLTVGVNWYLNNNLKLQFDYVHNNRSDLPATAVPGNTDGLGIRCQFMF
jgi:phosphate-selective porin OprO/OprP